VVTVIGPDGQRYESGSPQVDSTVVTAEVNTLPVAGAYTIAYRIVSADGHPVQGEIKFELADAAIAPPAPASSPAVAETPGVTPSSASASLPSSAAPASSTSEAVSSGPVTSTSTAAVAPAASSSGLSGWVWAAIAVAAILVAAAIVVIVRRPQQPE
jgi:hypothetical protein